MTSKSESPKSYNNSSQQSIALHHEHFDCRISTRACVQRHPRRCFSETVRRGATGGFKAALAVQIGSLVGDATWAVLGLMGVGLLLQVDALKWPVGLVGAAYLIWLSWDSWKAASIAFSVNENQDEKALSGLKSATDRFASK